MQIHSADNADLILMQINKGYNVNMTNKWIEKYMETPRISFCFSCFTLQILQVFVLLNIVSSCSSIIRDRWKVFSRTLPMNF